MTANWVRRNYDAVGVTQSPPGKHLSALQEAYVGKALLCIDLSGWTVSRLGEAVAGARQFVTEAIERIMWWDWCSETTTSHRTCHSRAVCARSSRCCGTPPDGPKARGTTPARPECAARTDEKRR
jgi:hypothetical protein